MHTVPVTGRVDPLTLPALVEELDLPGGAVATVDGWRVAVTDPLAAIDRLGALDALTMPGGPEQDSRDEVPPFAAGWVGAITDDVSRALLELPAGDPRPGIAPLPPLWLGCYDAGLVVAPDGRAWGVAADLPSSGPAPARSRAERWARAAHAGSGRAADPSRAELPAVHRLAGGARSVGDPVWSLPDGRHEVAVRRAQEWIAAGDCYQINVTAQVATPWPSSAARLAQALWRASPASHAAYLALPGDVGVVSISPETFLRVRGRTATIRPIKGTRPRRSDRAADAAEARALRTSAKDAAEHVMIVDLERNDLGRVCRTGSVRVPDLAALEAHPSVWHLTSTVTGELVDGVGLPELLRATFPCGSVVGAPKRMAWQRASELEPVRRGVYCGAIGTVSPRGADLSVAIRTAVVHGGWASYGTGGGIVADSDPAAERQEAVDKARPFLEAAAEAAAEPPRASRSS